MENANTRLLRPIRLATSACIAIGVLAPIVVLLGWNLRNQRLTSIVPGCVAMNPLTAVCFIAVAVALWLRRDERAGLRAAAAKTLALVVAVCGLARLGSYAFGWGFGVDRLMFTSLLDVGGGPPNRMAPNTALNFVLVGASLWMLGRRIRLAQLLALGAGVTAFFVLVGYAYSVTSLERIAMWIPMSLPTAILFIVAIAAILGSRPEAGLMELVTGATAGGRMLRRLLPTLTVGPFVLGWLRLIGEVEGLYERGFGVALLVAAMVVMGVTMSWATAKALNRSEAERQRAEEITRRLAHYDHLTGLPNRMLFGDRLRQALARAERSRATVAVMFLDLDGFKGVNDTLGHDAGDQILKEAASRIQGAIRSGDTAARLGGDEFTVILEQIRTLDEVEAVAQRLLLQLALPYASTGAATSLSASIGIGLFPNHGQSPDDLLARADEAMYVAKRAGKNRFAFHALPSAA